MQLAKVSSWLLLQLPFTFPVSVHPHDGHAHQAAPACGCAHTCTSDGATGERSSTPSCAGGSTKQGCAAALQQICCYSLAWHNAYSWAVGQPGARGCLANGERAKRNQTCESQPDCTQHNRSAVSEAVSCCSGGQPCPHLLFSSSTSQTGSKVIAFSPVELMLLYVRANQRRICPARSALVKLSSRVNLLFGLWDRWKCWKRFRHSFAYFLSSLFPMRNARRFKLTYVHQTFHNRKDVKI